MTRTIVAAAILTGIVILFTGCSSDDGQNRQSNDTGGNVVADSSRPFALMSLSEREELRDSLRNAGQYDCCVKPGCMECIASLDSCGCYIAIKQNDPICGECLNGYREGRGKLKLVSIVELERIRNKANALDN